MNLKVISQHIVEDIKAPIRLQEYGVGIFAELPTKSSLKKAIKKNRILVNGTRAKTSRYIYPNDVIELLDLPVRQHKIYEIDLHVQYEDDYLAIIEKPAGISVSGNKFSTIQNALEPHIAISHQADATYPHPVHRLDYATSGLLIIGKTATARRELHKMFELKKINKTYHAVTVGQMPKSNGIINASLEGKSAITEYQVLNSLISDKFDALNLVKLMPKTGRKHQLRKHLFLLGNPIMGDQKYYLPNKQHKGYGLYLHASALSFQHPVSHENVNITSKLPKKFTRLFPNI